jgi:hypothetical protein
MENFDSSFISPKVPHAWVCEVNRGILTNNRQGAFEALGRIVAYDMECFSRVMTSQAPSLLALNREGVLTFDHQVGRDNANWQRRAYVEGIVLRDGVAAKALETLSMNSNFQVNVKPANSSVGQAEIMPAVRGPSMFCDCISVGKCAPFESVWVYIKTVDKHIAGNEGFMEFFKKEALQFVVIDKAWGRGTYLIDMLLESILNLKKTTT